MPSISVQVAPITQPNPGPGGTPAGGPVIGGVTFRRPTSRSVNVETVRNTVDLPNGDLRTYVVGRRRVVSISWSKMLDYEVAALSTILANPFTTYAEDGSSVVFSVNTDDGFSSDAIAGTDPIRYSVSVTLRERKATR